MDTHEQDDPHLTPERWRALQARDPEAVRHFARHLGQPCDACEAFLAEAPGDDALEALADEALTVAAPATDDTLGWERVRRRAFPPRHRRVGAAAAGLALAAAAALVLVLVPQQREGADTTEPGTTRLKGDVPLALELSTVAQLPGGSVRAVADGEALPEAAVVLVRYHASEAATATLVLRREGAVEQVLGQFELAPGTHDLQGVDGEPVGVALRGERGRVALSLEAQDVRAQLHLTVRPE